MNKLFLISGLAVLAMLVGCGGDEGAAGPAAPPTGGPSVGAPTAGTQGVTGPVDLESIAKKMNVPYAKPLAGMEVKPTLDPGNTELRLYAENRGFRSRRDPFALLPVEKAFENAQRREKLFSEGISFGSYFEVPEPKPSEEDILEPPPNNWRLAGIFQGNGITAIMTNGSYPALQIKPGTQIPGSEWYVASIDAEKAILRRRNNKRPREWVVRLQGAFDFGGPPAGGNQGGSGETPPLPGGGRDGDGIPGGADR